MKTFEGRENKSGMYRAIYPGSFDPITIGHLDILDRARKLFDEIVVVVAGTAHKDPLFEPEERLETIRQVVESRKNVKVDLWSGLIMDYAKKNNIQVVIRGLRAASDFEYELMMASMNKQLNSEVETLFMMTSQDLFFVSSSMVKELFRYGADISPYVSPVVVDRLRKKFQGA